MKNYLHLLSLLSLLTILACGSDDFTHQHSLSIANNSDSEITVRLYQRDLGTNFPISKDSFNLVPQSEETFYEVEYSHDSWEGLLCGLLDIDSIKFIVENGLQMNKDIDNYMNWIGNSDGSSKNHKVQNCRFVIENDDLE